MPERFLGRTLGKYRLDALIGTGGFAWVYRGLDPELGLTVAVKVLKPQFAGDPAFEERFRREASTAARLRHPNIITIYAVGRDGDAVYFAMDYLPQNLADRLGVTATLPGAVLVRLGLDVASALGYAHREGIVHRDVKPDNILFDDHGNAVVADFGIARAVAAHAHDTGTQFVVGTPHYFAPEQARGRSVDGRADLYALGVTLYRAAAGVLPFPGDDWYEVARQHVEIEPADVRTHNPAISTDLARVIHRCLEKDPDDRYPTAEALSEALEAVPDRGDATTSRTIAVPALDRLWTTTGITARRRRLRRRVLWTTAAATVAVTVGALALGGHDVRPVSVAAAPPPAESLGVVAPMPPADSLVASDSAAADSAARPAAPPPAPTRGHLAVSTPDEARVYLDDRLRGTGSWESELRPGRYVVRAVIPDAPEGCTTARKEQMVVLAAGERRSVRLAPVGCGRLAIAVRVGDRPIEPARGAMYNLTGGGLERRGAVPVAEPLVLPAGDYQLQITAPQCSAFDGRIHIAAGATTAPPIRLLCTPAPR
ncbi:MAG TPA: serine/threonine-protein kinase [Gemmatimonadaceae bacterium]|nr:serine/threonine-protein kinase [Gemmatimonadaceae bacterium]